MDAIETFLNRVTLHADADIRVIDKPYGLAVQKGTRTTEDLDSWLMARSQAGHERLRLVHRLDKETAGCLILAASQEAARLLGRELEARRVAKTYWALVHGVPSPSVGRIDIPLIKARRVLEDGSASGLPGDTVRTALPSELATAWTAETHYEVLDNALTSQGDRFSFVRLMPQTGRQHQLRAHLAAIGHPIVGDSKYPAPAFEQATAPPGQSSLLHLLARGLTFRHPKGHRLTIQAPLPTHMRVSFEQLRFAAALTAH
jgi:23S rRNA pseudouridine955/2504/2580 synthase